MSRTFFQFSILLLLLFKNDSAAAQVINTVQFYNLDAINKDSLHVALSNAIKNDQYNTAAKIYAGIGEYFVQKEIKDSVLFYYMKVEEQSQKAGDSLLYYYSHLRIGRVYLQTKNIDMARLYFLKAEDYYTRNKQYDLLAHTKGALSEACFEKKDSVCERNYLLQAIAANEKGKDTFMLVILNYKYIQKLTKSFQYTEAIKHLERNLDIIRGTQSIQANPKQNAVWTTLQLNMLGYCYYVQKDYETAVYYLKQVLPFTSVNGVYSIDNSVCYRHLADCYTMLGKRDSALTYIKHLFRHVRDMADEMNPEKMSEMSVKYEAEKKQRQIESLQQKSMLQEIQSRNEKWIIGILALMLALAAIAVFYIVKVNKEKRMALAALEKQREENLRNTISRDLHDEIGSSLSGIQLFSQMAEQGFDTDPLKSKEYLDKIKQYSDVVLTSMKDIVWEINPENDNMQNMVHRLRQYAAATCAAANIEIDFTVADSAMHAGVDMRYRRNIYLIAKEAINNSVKHSGCSKISCCMETSGNVLKIYIKDNGKGFSRQGLTDGNGIHNMKHRAKDMQATLDIISNDNGTEIILTCKTAYA
ncbi:MAG: tetratricopeptide repeat protein [Chitinophagaceae bacterium]|nr:tetratricopeptide repeat protein [Chitinophagaceae bacterium]